MERENKYHSRVFLAVIIWRKIMDENVTLIISRSDATQILDGLCQRLETWRYTERYLQTGYADESYCVEECSDVEEAHRIAKSYGALINSVEQQSYDCK